MLSKVLSSAIVGIDAFIIEVEVDVSPGLPAFTTVGLPDNTVKESRERVIAATKNSGYKFPPEKITVNLAPADIRKEGSGFDLPIATGILATTKVIKGHHLLDDSLIVGELSLDGRVKPIRGALSVAFAAKKAGIGRLILPAVNSREASLVKGIDVFGVDTLADVVGFLNEEVEMIPSSTELKEYLDCEDDYRIDLNEVRGQEYVKRALEVAAAGGHNILMIGPPGSGKTMIARRLPTILPDMNMDEAIEATKIHSIAGTLAGGKPFMTCRPFRSPHHTISDAGLIGGGHTPRPGEVSLAHNGILFLDEMPEFKKNVLEVLRQPLEDGSVTISRATISLTYPSRFVLVAAMNPCSCGFFGDDQRECSCSPLQVQRYRAKISGPLLDRIDIHCEVPAVRFRELSGELEGESSMEVRERVVRARKIQSERFSGSKKVYCNSQMTNRYIRRFCSPDENGKKLLEMAIDKLGFSARGYTRVLKVARTIADLGDERNIKANHLSQAIQYRTLDRKYTI